MSKTSRDKKKKDINNISGNSADNGNQNHNTKKESSGPNTKR